MTVISKTILASILAACVAGPTRRPDGRQARQTPGSRSASSGPRLETRPGHVGRGHHGVSAAQRAACAVVPGSDQANVTVNVTYLVGSRHEDYGETGMAPFGAFDVQGLPQPHERAEGADVHGSRPNGTTWYDRTNYFETFQASDENLEWALELESDRMVNSFIARRTSTAR